MRALVSIHDVMPETLPQVAALIDALPPPVRPGTLLLVVPGRHWRPGEVGQLARWQSRGLELAGHGWRHRAVTIRGWYHRCHAGLVSRQAAEHLSLSRAELRHLLERNYDWFVRHRLAPPSLYVPPAWALGRLGREDLAASPFAYVETTGGLRDCATGEFRWLPLLGFEADTRWRALALAGWNRVNGALAGADRPPRVALHPFDPALKLAGPLRTCLQTLTRCADYRHLFPAREGQRRRR